MTSLWIRRLVGAGVCVLLLSTPALAQPRGGPPAQPAQPADPTVYLTAQEQVCQAFGIFIYNRALDRDNGWAMTDVLARSRQWDAEHGMTAEVQGIHNDLTLLVYQGTATPTQLRNALERGCVTPAPTAAAPAPERTRQLWR